MLVLYLGGLVEFEYEQAAWSPDDAAHAAGATGPAGRAHAGDVPVGDLPGRRAAQRDYPPDPGQAGRAGVAGIPVGRRQPEGGGPPSPPLLLLEQGWRRAGQHRAGPGHHVRQCHRPAYPTCQRPGMMRPNLAVAMAGRAHAVWHDLDYVLSPGKQPWPQHRSRPRPRRGTRPVLRAEPAFQVRRSAAVPCPRTGRCRRGPPEWIGHERALPGGQVLKGGSHARTAIGCRDRPGDEPRRSHEWLERGHHVDVPEQCA